MQSTDMRVIRTLHLHRTLSSKTLNPLIAFSESGKNPQFPKKLVPYPQFRLFSVNADQSSGASWSNFANVPPQTSEVEAVYDPVTGRVVTKRESKSQSSKEPTEDNGYPEKEKSYDTRSRKYSEVMETNTAGVNSRVSDSFIRKKGKVRTVFVCEKCGHSGGQWWGTCKQCGEVGTMKRFSVGGGETKAGGVNASGNVTRTWLPSEAGEAGPIKLSDVYGKIDENWRIPLPGQFGAEVERVLGGGLVPGSLTLVGGDPGIGKSTLVLQIAALLADGNDSHAPAGVIYVSGEESVEQIGNRADRLSIGAEELYLYSSTDVEDILQQVQRLSPRAVVIDSIQTVYLTGVTGSAGGPMQVKECTSALLRFAKKTNIPVLLIGHVNKTGDIAGPRVLEHIVDVVLYMEGESGSSHRLLRSVKNRFGSTDELGVFKMSQFGLQVVLNPTEMFLGEQHSDSDYLAGLAVAVIMDGARAFLIEIQALCVAGSTTVRHVNGIQASRADMLISVIMKQAGLKIQENGIYLNVVSGITLSETAGDLAVVAAICSSFLEFPIPNGIAFIAEVDLVGELRMVPQLEKRVNTLAKLGYKKCIVPKFAESTLLDLQLHGIEIIGCRNLKEMIHYVFRSR